MTNLVKHRRNCLIWQLVATMSSIPKSQLVASLQILMSTWMERSNFPWSKEEAVFMLRTWQMPTSWETIRPMESQWVQQQRKWWSRSTMPTLILTRASTSAATWATITGNHSLQHPRHFSRRATRANKRTASSVRKDGLRSRRKITATCTWARTVRIRIPNESPANLKSSTTKMHYNKAKTT